jgi:uncharacterized membrane protein YccC
MGVLHTTLILVALAGMVLAVVLDVKQTKRLDRMWREHMRRLAEDCKDCLT